MRVQLLLLKGCGCADLDDIYIYYIYNINQRWLPCWVSYSYNAKRLQLLEKCEKITGAGPSVHEVVEASGEACGLSIHLATPKSK